MKAAVWILGIAVVVLIILGGIGWNLYSKAPKTNQPQASPPSVVIDDHEVKTTRQLIENEKKLLERDTARREAREELAALKKAREELTAPKKEEKKDSTAPSKNGSAAVPVSTPARVPSKPLDPCVIRKAAEAETQRVVEAARKGYELEIARMQFQRLASAEKAKEKLIEDNEKEVKRILNFNECLFNAQKAIADMGWWSDYLSSATTVEEKARRWDQYEKWTASVEKRFRMNQSKLVPVIKTQQKLRESFNELSRN